MRDLPAPGPTAQQALARMYAQRVPSRPKQIGRMPEQKVDQPWYEKVGRAAFGIVASPFATALDVVPGYEPEDVGSFNIFEQGGKSLQHVAGDAYQLGRSVLTGKDTLSESPSARAYQQAGGGLMGTAAAALPYVDVASVVAPFAKGMTPAGALAIERAAGEAVTNKLTNQIMSEAEARAAYNQMLRDQTLQKARVATQTGNVNAYDQALGEYALRIHDQRVPPSQRVGGIWRESPLHRQQRAARETNIAIQSATDAKPTSMLVGISPEKATQLVSDQSGYGSMFDATKKAQIADERMGYQTRFTTPELIRELERRGIAPTGNYETDRLIVESQFFGVPVDAPMTSRPTYAINPNVSDPSTVASYSLSPNESYFGTFANFDVANRPITTNEFDSFPGYFMNKRIFPGEMSGKPGFGGAHNKYSEMQVWGGPVPFEKLQNIEMAAGLPNSLRYTNPEEFFNYARKYYPMDESALFGYAKYDVQSGKEYIDRQIALLKTLQKAGIPANVRLTGMERVPQVDEIIAGGERSANLKHLYTPHMGETMTPISWQSVTDPSQQLDQLESISRQFQQWLDWAETAGPKIEQRVSKLYELRNKADTARNKIEFRAADRAAAAKIAAGITQEDVALARSVTPYPVRVLPDLEDFLKAVVSRDLDQAADIWSGMYEKWKVMIKTGETGDEKYFFMTTPVQGLRQLNESGLISASDMQHIHDRVMPYVPPVVDSEFTGIG